jgi:hypothetical protein
VIKKARACVCTTHCMLKLSRWEVAVAVAVAVASIAGRIQ